LSQKVNFIGFGFLDRWLMVENQKVISNFKHFFYKNKYNSVNEDRNFKIFFSVIRKTGPLS